MINRNVHRYNLCMFQCYNVLIYLHRCIFCSFVGWDKHCLSQICHSFCTCYILAFLNASFERKDLKDLGRNIGKFEGWKICCNFVHQRKIEWKISN